MSITRTILTVVVAFAGLAFAGDDTPGECPQVAPVDSFDLEKFVAGKWYLVEQSDNDADKCVTVELTSTPAKTIHTKGTEKDGDVIDKTYQFTATTPGILSVIDGNEARDYVVVASHYDRYAVVYKCDHDVSDNDHEVELWIYVRGNLIEDPSAVINEAKTAISGKGIAINQFYPVSHSDCGHNV